MKKLLVVVDFQYDFIMEDGKLPIAGAEDLIVPAHKFLANLDPEEYAAVVFTYDTHDPEVYKDSEEAKQFPPHCERFTPGWSLVVNPDTIPINIPVVILEKGVFNMWEETDVEISTPGADELYDRDVFFDEVFNHVDTVDIFGVALNVCVEQAVRGFAARGWNVNVIESLCKGIDLGNPSDTDAKILFEGVANVI